MPVSLFDVILKLYQEGRPMSDFDAAAEELYAARLAWRESGAYI